MFRTDGRGCRRGVSTRVLICQSSFNNRDRTAWWPNQTKYIYIAIAQQKPQEFNMHASVHARAVRTSFPANAEDSCSILDASAVNCCANPENDFKRASIRSLKFATSRTAMLRNTSESKHAAVHCCFKHSNNCLTDVTDTCKKKISSWVPSYSYTGDGS